MDSTVLGRQKRRIQRLAENGLQRSTLFVHRECKTAFDGLRPYFAYPSSAPHLLRALAELDAPKAAALAKLPRLSPFRYPGGKSWLVGQFRHWFNSLPARPSILVEPFAGGASVGLAVAADMTTKVLLSDLDESVASVWMTIFHRPVADVDWLCDRIEQFDMTAGNVRDLTEQRPRNRREAAFRTIVMNRTRRGGVLADGAGHLRRGEDGKGVRSRWYPGNLVARIRELWRLRGRVSFRQQDALSVIRTLSDRGDVAFFVDPPYTAGGPKPGRRLYRHHEVDHRDLLRAVRRATGPAMITYADTPEVRALAEETGFKVVETSMRTAHHREKRELLLLKA